MKVFANSNFLGHWPVGTAVVIIAENLKEAKELLDAELIRREMSQKLYVKDLEEVSLDKSKCIILCDGNY